MKEKDGDVVTQQQDVVISQGMWTLMKRHHGGHHKK